MKKKTFNLSTVTRSGRSTGHYVSISARSGLIKFSKDMVDLLRRSRINFIQDESKPTDWYVEITKSEQGFNLRNGQLMQSVPLCIEILKSIGNQEGRTIRMMINPKPDDGLFAIITKSAKAVTRKSKS